jgi:nuclear transport factor 2 (NTF2) superfamily protein
VGRIGYWEFDEDGLMPRRQARINDLLIRNSIASFIGMLRSLALWIIPG